MTRTGQIAVIAGLLCAATASSTYAGPQLVAWDPSRSGEWRSEYYPRTWSYRHYDYDFGQVESRRVTRFDIEALRAFERMR